MNTYSVVLPAYNAERTIGTALESIANQLLPVNEVVVVDDGSKDSTVEYVLKWEKKLPLRLIRNPVNLGLVKTLNIGVNAANFDWILRLDADDRWLPEHVALIDKQVGLEGVELISSKVIYESNTQDINKISSSISDSNVRSKLMWNNPIVHSSVAFAKSAFLKVGGYKENVTWEDYDLWIEILSHYKFGFTDKITAVYTVSETSLSRIPSSKAYLARFLLQLKALKLFWRRHIFSAFFICLLTSFRFLLLKLK